MDIKILGSGCANCTALQERAREAVAQLGLTATFGHVRDAGEIAGYGVMRTPGLVVDDEVLVSGRVPTVAQIAQLLSATRRP